MDPNELARYSSPLSGLVAMRGGVAWLEFSEDGTRLARICDGDRRNTPVDGVIRSRVNEYGGGAHAAAGDQVVICDDAAACLRLIDADGGLRDLTAPDPEVRYGDLRFDGRTLLAVEEHAGTTRLIGLDVTRDESRVIAEGADFYANPALGRDGTIAWIEWDLPHMPWQGSRLYVMVDGSPVLVDEAAQHPLFLTDGRLLYTRDDEVYSFHVWDGDRSHRIDLGDHDIDLPLFILGSGRFAALDDHCVATARMVDGRVDLVVADLDTGETRTLLECGDIDSIACHEGTVYAIIDPVDDARALVAVDQDATVRIVSRPAPTPPHTSRPRSVSFEGRHGPVQAWFYPPIDGGVGPVIVRAHGGPTAMATSAWYGIVQFWTSRGYAYLDVNYSGSAGFGRRWRDRLDGNWGVSDVDDCCDAAEHVAALGWVDPTRMVMSGNSAGGFTTLHAACRTTFDAAICQYGVTDLMALTNGHKFESHYADSLVGPLPDSRALYEQRSPKNLAARIRIPILLIQGDEDPIVPLSQAQSMQEEARRSGADATLIVMPGEGHGFSSDGKAASLTAQVEFLDRVLAQATE